MECLNNNTDNFAEFYLIPESCLICASYSGEYCANDDKARGFNESCGDFRVIECDERIKKIYLEQ